jgi:hypothetical protein
MTNTDTVFALFAALLFVAMIFRRALIVPIIFAAFWYLMTFVPTWFGFPLPEAYVRGREAVLLTAYDKYVVVRFVGDEQPRLIEIVPSEQSKQAAEQAKNGLVVIRFGASHGGAGGSGEASMGGVELVPLEQAEGFNKS